MGFQFCWGLTLRSTPVPQAGKPNCSPDWPHQGGKESWTPPWKLRCFFWSQAKSAEQLISKIIFPTQYSDVTALIKNERASPQNAKLKNFLRLKLYLKSETNFFSLQVFTGSQGSKKWRRARHHHAIFLTKTKNQKNIFFFFLFTFCFSPPRVMRALSDFPFWVSPGP